MEKSLVIASCNSIMLLFMVTYIHFSLDEYVLVSRIAYKVSKYIRILGKAGIPFLYVQLGTDCITLESVNSDSRRYNIFLSFYLWNKTNVKDKGNCSILFDIFIHSHVISSTNFRCYAEISCVSSPHILSDYRQWNIKYSP